jgi:hypothetical protein
MKPETIQGYTIIERAKINDVAYVLAENQNAVNPYVVWLKDADLQSYHWGHYFNRKADGLECLYAFAHREAKTQNEITKSIDEKANTVPTHER